jgi:hypothetical protein
MIRLLKIWIPKNVKIRLLRRMMDKKLRINFVAIGSLIVLNQSDAVLVTAFNLCQPPYSAS